MTDETKHAAQARALLDSEEGFRLLIESVREYAIFMLDSGGYVASWNAGAERIKGYRAHEIIGRHFSTFYAAEDLAAAKPARHLEIAREQGRVEDEGWRLRKDGGRFWANVVITALRDAQGNIRGFAKLTRDLTDQRAREEAEGRAALASEASRLKDDFLAIVSHELRTPLNVIQGQATRLRAGNLSHEDQERAWASLHRNLQLQTRIIEDLLDVSRIVSGKLALRRERVDVLSLVKEAVDEVQTAAAAKDVTVTKEYEPTDARVMGDPLRLRQIVANLLSNAVKFTPSGGRVAVTCRRVNDEIVLQVSDTGVGIASELLGTLFERFTQGDSSVRRESGGLGLGLAIARELTTRHGGSIEAISGGKGQGATFAMRLPIAAES